MTNRLIHKINGTADQWDKIPDDQSLSLCRTNWTQLLVQELRLLELVSPCFGPQKKKPGWEMHTRIFSVLRESSESQGGDPLGSQSESWKFKKDDSEKQTVLVILLTLDLWLIVA